MCGNEQMEMCKQKNIEAEKQESKNIKISDQ